ncbi:GNAT family N-acetyltransferase [Nocardioides dongxiaopingii]|uniref:GNAT family N-acetyltransferase n=1 Tax=Nocardioides dongxiaopingii TaxID=2576036 RepID=UPI0010C76791|nr:GNAT family N-acetyltransferase [Nocardioides dongxiaopingii]
MSELLHGVLDVGDESEAGRARVEAWSEAVHRSFLEARPDDGRTRRLVDNAVAQSARVAGAWRPETTLPGAEVPVGTLASWQGEITVAPGRSLPLHMITDVTVAPTHRRRGLARRLMTDDLAHAVAQGRPLAALTVSEGSIYGRFGFGLGTRLRHVVVDLGARFALRREPAPPGTFTLVDPATAWPHVQRVFAAHAAATRGAVGRPQFYESILTGAFDWESGSENRKLRAVLHLDAGGAADGYALWSLAGQVEGRETIDVVDLVGLTPEVQVALWRQLADIDLVEQARWRRAPLSGVLDWALTDPRVVTTTKVADLLWVRVLDVPAALGARAWGADGSVVLDVDDALGHAAGRWRVEVVDGVARVGATEDAADLRLAADTLGALYLGGVTTDVLAAAGRLVGEPSAVQRWARMADVGPEPWCTTGF